MSSMGFPKRLVELLVVTGAALLTFTTKCTVISDVRKVETITSPKLRFGVQVDTISATSPFISPNYSTTQTQIGTTAILHCEVMDLGENTVLWIRRRDYQLLTIGLQTYSSDTRFFTSNAKNGQDWALHIRHSHIKDGGLYECQLTTHPASSLFVQLELVEAHADIIGGTEKIVKAGSLLRLSCVLKRFTETPAYVFWYHHDRMINFDLQGGAAVRHGRQGSELIIPKARTEDAGVYSCVPSNARSANVTVHVLQNEKPAAMQHDIKSASSSIHPVFLLSCFSIFYEINR